MPLIVIAKDDENFTYGFQHEWGEDRVEDYKLLHKLMNALEKTIGTARDEVDDEQQGESDTEQVDEQQGGVLGEGTSEHDSANQSEDTSEVLPEDGSGKLDLA